jgi:uncharacterized membrane protein YjjP (DUF1212 family)
MSQDIGKRIDLLLDTGRLLMESGADTPRIMRNMKRTAAFLCLREQDLQIYVNLNLLMVNYAEGEESYTKFKRCNRHGINMTVISYVSKLSWRAIREDYTCEQYAEALDEIENRRPNYTPWQVAVGGGFACGGFCIQFGCDWPAFVYASLSAILGFRLRQYLNSKGSNQYVNIAIASFLSTILAWVMGVCNVLHSSTPWHPLMACALFIVPGVPLINFVNDMLTGYTQIGLTRAINTLLMVLAMAFGIAFAIDVTGLDNFVRDLTMTPHHEYWEFSLAAAVSAVGFSMIFNIPRRLLWVVAVGGIVAVCTRNIVNLGPSTGNIGLDQGLIVGSFMGSALISIICTKAMHWFHTPHHCLSIPSVIPMIPGVLMYRALFAVIDMHGVVGEVTVAMHNGIRASLIILCIALGVAIPNIFVRRMVATKREQKLLRLLSERADNSES